MTDTIETLSFSTRDADGVLVLDFAGGGCRPASDKEAELLTEIERLSRELQEAKEALKPFAELEAALDRIANVVGEDEPSIMWPWAQEIARSVLSPKESGS